MLSLDAKFMLRLGLRLAGHKIRNSEETNLRRFKASYGTKPEAVAQIWHDLTHTTIPAARVDAGVPVTKLFWALTWLKTYPTEEELAGRLHKDEKTVRTWVWYFVKRLYLLKSAKILFPQVAPANRARYLLTIDGTDCPIQEPSNFSKSWFSHKFKGPAVKYELGVDMEGNLVWISGPYRGSINDLTIFRRVLKALIPKNFLCIADSGYKGEPGVISIPNKFDSPAVKAFKQRARSRHETMNKRIKDFRCVSSTFRHSVDKHPIVFGAVAVLCQYNIEAGETLFEL
jgi:hypothetical protein